MRKKAFLTHKGYDHFVYFTHKGYGHIVCILTLLMLVLAGCGEYQKVLKSTDPEFKYNKAIEYFNAGEYVKAQTLLDDVTSYFRGTERSEDVLIYLARCYMGQKVYDSAAEYYEAYTRSYPKGKNNMEARFMVAHAYYMDSPDARLDQKQTHTAIEYYTQFIELFPESSYAQQAYSERQEMYDKLAYKELLSARLYYNLGTYLGNNYVSCETVSKNALKKYPASPYTEEFCWLIFAAKYQQMVYSTAALLDERAREAQDEYYSFVTEFPESKHVSQAKSWLKNIKKVLKSEEE